MVKVLTACGNGMGSSMVIKMKVENALRNLGQTDFTVNSCSVGEAKSLASGYDIAQGLKFWKVLKMPLVSNERKRNEFKTSIDRQ